MRQTRSRARIQSTLSSSPGASARGPANDIQTQRESEIEQLKKDINSLSLLELQTVLQFLPLDKTKKSVLRERCIDLLKSEFTRVQQTVKKILSNRVVSRNMYQQNMGMVVGQTGNGTLSVPHSNGVPVTQYNLPQGYPIHPDVRLKKLAFFDVMATLLKPSTLVPINSQRVQEGTYYFHLTPQQATDIASNRDIRNNSKVEHVIQVQLRFCLLETSCEQEDYFPPNVVVKVNNKLCALPNPIPTNKPGVEPKRPPRPVNITTNVKLSPTVANHISVSWCTEYARGYVVSAYLVKKLTSAQLLHRMKSKGVKPSDFTRGLIKEKLNEDADCEIATTMLKVSLVCPLGKMRMTTPCRASTCSHLQCFDASLYLQMNERKPTWNCPVCDKPAIYENLVIDGYFQEVLASPNLAPDTNEIQLHKDGSWSTHVMKNDSEILDTPSKVIQKVEVISDDLEVITSSPVVKPTINVPPPSRPSNEPTSTTNTHEISSVDLTLSDSDDDLPLKSKVPPQKAAPVAVQSGGNSNNTNSNSNITQSNANSAASKTNNNNDISIISLDSPSPPSSPVQSTAYGNGSSNQASTIEVVSSTTAALYNNSNFTISTNNGTGTSTILPNNYTSPNIAQMASSRIDFRTGPPNNDLIVQWQQQLQQHQTISNYHQRLMQSYNSQQSDNSNKTNNWNISNPHRYDQNR